MNAIPQPPSSLSATTYVLVGMPGAGKSSIGRRLAARLGLPFVDSDAEVEQAAGMTVPEIFAKLGEAAFREGERRVMARLLDGSPHVIATGGGAFIDPATRALIHEKAVSIWLRVDLDILHHRVARNDDRPLLKQGDAAATLRRLLDAREAAYAEADVVVLCDDRPHEETTERVMEAVAAFAAAKDKTGSVKKR